MKKRALFLALTLCYGLPASAQSNSAPLYMDADKPIDERVDDLVSRMTLNEKIMQMYNDAPAIERLNVPAYDYWNEALHGVARAGEATVFPQAIGLAAMWDKPLLHEIATAISDEGRAKHHYFNEQGVTLRYTGLTYWSPNINIFRDPRWGRGQETYGEDPYLTGELAVSFIKGLQGDNPEYLKTAATAKHFAVHNGPEITRHSDNYVVSNKDLYETYLPAFKKAVVDGGVEAVMCAYNRVNDVPACGSEMLLKDILRDTYKFDGHVMSDCGAIADFYDPDAHDVVKAPAAAAAWAVTAGTDLNCGTGRLNSFANLNFAVEKGLIDEALIDQAVTRLFTTRFRLGMFDPAENVPYSDISMDVVGSDSHLALTQKAAESSLVLLKNDGTLPLKSGTRVAVIGPNADNIDVLLGNYNGLPVNPVTPLKAIQQALGEENVSYAAGSPIIDTIYGNWAPLTNKVLSYKDEKGTMQPGAKAEFYKVNRLPRQSFTHLRQPVEIAGSAVSSSVLEKLDMRYLTSPVDNAVTGDFAVKISAMVTPETTGDYRFNSDAVMINGKPVENTITLKAGTEYAFEATRFFVNDKLSNTSEALRADWNVSWVNTSEAMQSEAVKAAQSADVVLVFAGISPRIEGEEMPVKLDGFNYGDRSSIDLPAVQQKLLKALKQTGKPMVLVNFSGSAMALNWSDKNANAIVQAFYPGEAAGTAIKRLLWGEVNPSGRLPVTFYRNLDGFAAFDDYAMTNRTYRYFKGKVLYPFGHGLSYSEVAYNKLEVPDSLSAGDDLAISVTLTNKGTLPVEQVTQVYISMPDAPVSTPQVALAGFAKSQVAPGATETLRTTLAADTLTYVDENGKHQPYKGKLELSVGDGQPEFARTNAVQKASITVK